MNASDRPTRDALLGAGERLQRERNRLLARWIEESARRLSSLLALPEDARFGSVPLMIDDLVAGLIGEQEGLSISAGEQHGRQRAQVAGFGLADLFVELEILHFVVFEMIESDGALAIEARALVHSWLFASTRAAAVAFSATQSAVIQEQKELLEAVIESMSEGVLAVNRQGEVLLSNPAMQHLRGLPPTSGPPASWPEYYGLFLPDMRTPLPIAEMPILKALRGDACDAVEIFVRNERVPEGLWECVSTRPLRDKDGRVSGAVAVISDITKRQRAEDQRKRALEELSRSNAELERFASVVSHDLREPLRMVTSYLALVTQRNGAKLDETTREFLAYAVDGARRMKGMIDALLDYAKITRASHPLRPVRLPEIVAEVERDLDFTITETHGEIRVSQLPQILGNRETLYHLFMNLIENALKFRRDCRPVIVIEAEEREREWLISVRDNGVGIDPERLPRVFDPFIRAHDENIYPGHGIGLAICKRAVELHHGRMWVETALGEGTVFFFTLPKVPEQA